MPLWNGKAYWECELCGEVCFAAGAEAHVEANHQAYEYDMKNDKVVLKKENTLDNYRGQK